MRFIKYQFKDERVHVRNCASVSLVLFELEKLNKNLILFEEISEEEFKKIHALMCIAEWMFKLNIDIQDVQDYVENSCTLSI